MYDGQRAFFDASNPANQHPVHIIGLGSYGSELALKLAKMGVKYLILQDFDTVTNQNVGVQSYGKSLVDMLKTEALKNFLPEHSIEGAEFSYINKKFEQGDDVFGRVVIGGVDSMEARKHIWESVLKSPNVALYIDMRANGDVCQVFYVFPSKSEDVAFYEKHGLFSDEEADSVLCTAKGVIDVPSVGVGLLMNMFRRFFSDPDIIPHDHYYDGQRCELYTTQRKVEEKVI